MPGKVVEHPIFGKGQTNNKDKPVPMLDGKTKIRVTLYDGRKLLCDPAKLKIIGFWD